MNPDNSACAYRMGFTIDIKSHVPPAPFGGSDYSPGHGLPCPTRLCGPSSGASSSWATHRWKLQTPPAPLTNTLSVTHELAVANGRGAQLVLCTITPKVPARVTPFQAVAKIYDPLYTPSTTGR